MVGSFISEGTRNFSRDTGASPEKFVYSGIAARGNFTDSVFDTPHFVLPLTFYTIWDGFSNAQWETKSGLLLGPLELFSSQVQNYSAVKLPPNVFLMLWLLSCSALL